MKSDNLTPPEKGESLNRIDWNTYKMKRNFYLIYIVIGGIAYFYLSYSVFKDFIPFTNFWKMAYFLLGLTSFALFITFVSKFFNYIK